MADHNPYIVLSRQWHWLSPPLSPACTAMDLDVAAADLGRLRNPALLGQGREDSGPDSPAAPSVPTIVDRRRGAVFRRAIRPAPAAFEHMNNPRDHSTIINPSRAGLVLRQLRLDRSPGLIAQPEKSAHAYLQHPSTPENLIC